jgi:hypothetical protein
MGNIIQKQSDERQFCKDRLNMLYYTGYHECTNMTIFRKDIQQLLDNNVCDYTTKRIRKEYVKRSDLHIYTLLLDYYFAW